MKTQPPNSKSVKAVAEQQKKSPNGFTQPSKGSVKSFKQSANVIKNVRPQGRGR